MQYVPTISTKKMLTLALLPIATLVLSACGRSSIDSRELQFNDGLAYQRNHQDPFTGYVTWAHGFPSFISDYYNRVAAMANLNPQLQGSSTLAMTSNYSCVVPYVKGVVEGEIRCRRGDGPTALTFTVTHEKVDGETILRWPFDPSKTFADVHWNNGVLDGRQTFYWPGTSTVMDEYSITNGNKDGREVYQDAQGNVVAKGTWNEGKPKDGSFAEVSAGFLRSVVSYAGGKLQGKASFYNPGYLSDPTTVSTGEFDNDMRTGEWIDYGGTLGKIEEQLNDAFPVLRVFPPYDHDAFNEGAFKNCWSMKTHWDHGRLAGKVVCFDKSGAEIVSLQIQNGAIVGDIQFHDSQSGTLVHIPQQDGHRVDSTHAVTPATTAGAPSLDTCVTNWTRAFHKERGDDWAPVTSSQMQEWEEWCKQGKLPPQV